MTDISRFNQSVQFKDVAVGQAFIEVLSPANIVYRRCNQKIGDKNKTVNARRLLPGGSTGHYVCFADWEPVMVEGEET